MTTTNQIIREVLESKIKATVAACPAGDLHVEYIMQSLDKHIDFLLTSIQEKIREGKKGSHTFVLYNHAKDEDIALIEEFKTKDVC